MDFIFRVIWAGAVAAVAWLICVFLGGILALTHQPILAYIGNFIETWAILIAVIAFLFAFVGGAPGSLVAYFNRRPNA